MVSPELAFSWRKLLLPLAEAGFHAVAPDQRGYGRTTGWNADFDDDVAPFRLLNLVRDASDSCRPSDTAGPRWSATTSARWWRRGVR